MKTAVEILTCNNFPTSDIIKDKLLRERVRVLLSIYINYSITFLKNRNSALLKENNVKN
jgi:hypothetical protein